MRYEYGIETEDKRECRYGMVIQSCANCIFETLCRLEKQKSLIPNQQYQWHVERKTDERRSKKSD